MRERALIKKMLQAIAENKTSMTALAAAMTHYTVYLHSMMKRCDTQGCESVATVHNGHLDFHACDNCAARAIVRGHRALMDTDRDESLDPAREAAAREELWRDLPTAQAIRMIDRHHHLISAGRAPEVLQ